MALSTPAKIATGLGATVTAATGSVLVYKYTNSLYSIENLAADKDSNWKIKAEGTDKIVFTATVATDNETLKSKYGLSEGVWTCKIKVKQGNNNNNTLKSKLKGYFGLGSDISADSGTSLISIPLENKTSFINSCSRHRDKTSSHSHNKVISEIEIDSSKLDEQFESLFGGVILFKPDRDAISAKNWTITTTNNSTETPKKVTVKSVITSPENSSWTCTITATVTTESTVGLDGIKPQLKKFLGVDIDTTEAVTANSIKKEYKNGFVKSCARNRKAGSSPSETQVEEELKLSLSTEGSGSTYKFIETDLEKVFGGSWDNPSDN